MKLINKDPKVQKSGNKSYQKIVAKHQDKQPLNERMKINRKAPYIIDVILYIVPRRKEGETEEEFEARKRKMKLYKKTYEQLGPPLSVSVTANIKTLSDSLLKLVEREQLVGDGDTTELFHMMLEVLKTNKEMKEELDQWASTPPDAMYLRKFNPDTRKNKTLIYQPLTAKLQNSQEEISIYTRYITTELDTKKPTLKDAITKEDRVINECWINTLMDFYGETVLSQNKSSRYRITREKLLDLLNVSEETVKNGLSVQDVLPFFEKFKLHLKVFNEAGRLIFKFSPEQANKNEQVCYVMIKGNHIYTLNNDQHSLKFKKVDDEEEELIKTPSTNYYLNEDAEPVNAVMISSVNDIPNVLEDYEEKNITLIHRDNDLTKCCMELIQSGYIPKIKFQGHRVTDIFCEFNSISIRIQTQHLIKTELDGLVCVHMRLHITK
jgi:hypothetical protein